jgi:hypothetical protein
MRSLIESGIAVLAAALFTTGDARSSFGFYSDINDYLMNAPYSEALAGADLGTSSGIFPASTPANLAFDSLNTLSLSYANYFHNTFSTSLLSFSSQAGENIGYGVTLGYTFLPDVEITANSDTSENGDPVYDPEIISLSRIYFRAGLGWKYHLNKSVIIAAGGAINGGRVNLSEYRGYSIGMDLGTRVLFSDPGISLAISFENIVRSVVYWSESYRQRVSPHIRVGIGWEREFPYIYGKVLIVYCTPDLLSNEGINYIGSDELADGVGIEGHEFRRVSRNPSMLFTAGRYGLEYTIMSRLALRVGLTQGKFSFGAGVNLFGGRAGLDFAYSSVMAFAGASQISLTYRW